MRFYLGSDHGGIEMREQLATCLNEWGHEVAAVIGPTQSSDPVDYPDVSAEVCQLVLSSEVLANGLLICGTGQGMAIAANKIPGIRAGAVADGFSAKMIREHNNANVICLGQRVLGSELASMLLKIFIETEFGGGRHGPRVEKINALD